MVIVLNCNGSEKRRLTKHFVELTILVNFHNFAYVYNRVDRFFFFFHNFKIYLYGKDFLLYVDLEKNNSKTNFKF